MPNDTLIFAWQRDLGERLLRVQHKYFVIEEESFYAERYLSHSESSPWELVERAHYRRRIDQ
jgi:hypothetical protein